MKRGKEIKLSIKEKNICNRYNVVFGTVDNKNPKALYINISAWGEPTSDNDINYDRVIKNLHKKVKQTLYQYLTYFNNNFNNEKTIVDFDMRESGITYNKRSFMSCEITLYQTNEIFINEPSLINEIENIIVEIITEVFIENQYFDFYKKKKK